MLGITGAVFFSDSATDNADGNPSVIHFAGRQLELFRYGAALSTCISGLTLERAKGCS